MSLSNDIENKKHVYVICADVNSNMFIFEWRRKKMLIQ